MSIVGAPGSGKTLLIVALAEELRRRGHRVGSAEMRGAVLVITLPSGGRVTAQAPNGAGEILQLVQRLDPQLSLLLLERPAPDGSIDAHTATTTGIPTIALVSHEHGPFTPRGDLLAEVSIGRITGAFAAAGPGNTLGLATLVEQRLLGASLGSSLDMKTESPSDTTRQTTKNRLNSLVQSFVSALQEALHWLRHRTGEH